MVISTGYDTCIGMDLKVKEDRMMNFIAAYAEAMDAGEGWAECYDDLSMSADRSLTFNDNAKRLYDEEPFYDFLKNFVEEGKIDGWGDDPGDYWRIYFDGQGNWKRQVPVFVDEGSYLAEEYGD